MFPLAFLRRHHVELALKDIIATGRCIEGEPWGFPAHHSRSLLWVEAKPHIEKCGPADEPELANVEANIREFEFIAPGSDGFRYPLGRDRRGRSLPNAPDYVNLRALHDAMEVLANFLGGVRSELGERRDFVAMMEAQSSG